MSQECWRYALEPIVSYGSGISYHVYIFNNVIDCKLFTINILAIMSFCISSCIYILYIIMQNEIP